MGMSTECNGLVDECNGLVDTMQKTCRHNAMDLSAECNGLVDRMQWACDLHPVVGVSPPSVKMHRRYWPGAYENWIFHMVRGLFVSPLSWTTGACIHAIVLPHRSGWSFFHCFTNYPIGLNHFFLLNFYRHRLFFTPHSIGPTYFWNDLLSASSIFFPAFLSGGSIWLPFPSRTQLAF